MRADATGTLAVCQAGKEKVQRLGFIPSNVWEKCKKCEEAIYRKDLEKNLWVCPKCEYHFRLPNADRITLMADEQQRALA